MTLFPALINPVTVHSFFENHWTKKELHLKNHFDASTLFSLTELTSLLKTNQEHLQPPVIRLIKNGKTIAESKFTTLVNKRRQATAKQISFDKVVTLCENGSTLVFSGLNNYSEKLSDYCSKLSEELNEPTQINCYLTQKGTQGFEPHYDHHEIFILQVEGEKEWELFGSADSFPLPANNHYHQGEPDRGNKRNFSLKAGDVLYIPRGMWHQAKADKASSLHLTLNIMCSLNLDFLHWAIDHLAETEPLLRKNLSSLPDASIFNKAYMQKISEEFVNLMPLFNEGKKQNEALKLPFIN